MEGCRRQERRFDPADLDNLAPVDRNFQQKLAGDAMFKAEHQKDDKAKASENENQIDKLERIKRRDRDAFSMNCELRRQFRFQKRNLNEQRAADTALKQKLSLGMDLLPSTSEDLEMAHALASGSKFKSKLKVYCNSHFTIIFSSRPNPERPNKQPHERINI